MAAEQSLSGLSTETAEVRGLTSWLRAYTHDVHGFATVFTVARGELCDLSLPKLQAGLLRDHGLHPELPWA